MTKLSYVNEQLGVCEDHLHNIARNDATLPGDIALIILSLLKAIASLRAAVAVLVYQLEEMDR